MKLLIIVLASIVSIRGVGSIAHATREHEIQSAHEPPVCAANEKLNEAKDTCIEVVPEKPAPAPAEAYQPVPAVLPPAHVENWGK